MENNAKNNGKSQIRKDEMPELEAAKSQAELPAPGEETQAADKEMLELEAADDQPASTLKQATAAAAAAGATIASKASDAASDVKNAAAGAADKAKETAANVASSVKSAVSDNIPKVDIPAPEHKSGIAWLWWILSLVFIAIIICCICRSCNGTENLKEDGDAVTKTTAAISNAKGGVAKTAKTLSTAALSSADNVALQQYQKEFNGVEYKDATAKLNSNGKSALDHIAALLKANPSLHIQIVGHASADGSKATNLKISEQRAKAVAQYLESQGISADRLSYVGWGEDRQVDPQHPYAQDNRCVTFDFTK